MKILLPSKGLYGQRLCSMRIPTLGDLHKIQSSSVEEDLRRIEFVQMICEDIDLEKITKCDLDYLFTLGTFALMMNVIKYDIQCPHCEADLRKIPVSITDQEVIDLDKNNVDYTRIIKKKAYDFHVLTAKEYLDACTYALGEEDYDKALEKALAAFTLGLTFDEIDKIKEEILPLYMATLLYQSITFHGLKCKSSTKCPKCGKEFSFSFPISTKVLFFSPAKLINNYVSVSSFVTMDDYLKLTVNEFNGLVAAINKMMEK